MRIEMSEVHQAFSDLTSSVRATNQSLSSAKGHANAVCGTDSLRGQVKSAINGELTNYTVPLITSYQSADSHLVQAFGHLINQFESMVQEGSSSAIIDTDALTGLGSELRSAKNNTDEVIQAANRAISSVADIISLGKLSKGKLDSKVQAATNRLKKVKANMAAFNGVKASGDIEAVLAPLKKTLGAVSKRASAAGAYNSTANRKFFKSKKYRRMLNKGITDADRLANHYLKKDIKGLNKTFAALNKQELSLIVRTIKKHVLNPKGFYDAIKGSLPFTVVSSLHGARKGLASLDKTLLHYYQKEDAKGIHFVNGPAMIGLNYLWHKVSSTKTISSMIKKGTLSSSLLHNLNKLNHLQFVEKLSKSKVAKAASGMWKVAGLVADPMGSIQKGAKNVFRIVGHKKLSTIAGEYGFKAMREQEKVINKLQKVSELQKVEAKGIKHRIKTNFAKMSVELSRVKGSVFKGTGRAISRIGRHAGKLDQLSGKGGVAAAAAFGGVSTAASYFNKSNKQTYHNVGHALVHVGVDSVKSAGPVSGMIVGAQVGMHFGPAGAAAGVAFGAALGGANWLWGKVNSRSKDKFYGSVESGLDNLLDEGKSSMNKSIKPRTAN